MTKTSVLRHFNLNCQIILKTDIFDLVISEILSQHDNENVLHSVTFYNKSMISAECNYYIYNKELLTIIHCFEHWYSELKYTDLLIKVFTDHQALKTFIKNKKLTHQQIRYLDILLEFNFQMIFWAGKINDKVNTLIQIFNFENKNIVYQIILTSDCVKIRVEEVKENLF